MAKTKSQKHWFHAKASNAKKKYIKKHPRSIYAGARSSVDASGAIAYRAQAAHMRAEINALREQMEKIDDPNSSHYQSLSRRLRLAQRKLAIFKKMN